MISSVAHHTYDAPPWVMGRTCGEPDEIGFAAMGVELNGWGRVLLHHDLFPARHGLEKRGETIREYANGQLDFVPGSVLREAAGVGVKVGHVLGHRGRGHE